MSRSAALALFAAVAGLALSADTESAKAASPATRPVSITPTTGPTTRSEAEEERAALIAEQAALPHRAAGPIGQALSAGIEDNFLHVRFNDHSKSDSKPDAEVNANADTEADAYTFDVTGWPGFAKVTTDPRGRTFAFQHRVMTDNDTVYTDTWVNISTDYLQIGRGVETATGTRTITLVQASQFAGPNDENVKLYVQSMPNEQQQGAVNLTLTASTFTDLARDHADAVRAYLLPILRDLGAADTVRGSDVARAYQVLGAALPPDTTMARRIDDLLKRLGQTDAADRAKAEDELQALGPAGAVELRRRDLSALPPDPRSAVDNVLRAAEPLPAAKATALAGDVPFLLDTLTLDNPALAAVAAVKLKALTGRAIDLPANLPAAERDRRIAAYTAAVAPTTQPLP